MLALIHDRGFRGGGSAKRRCPTHSWPPHFHHLPASEMEDLESGMQADVLVCSDHPHAAAVTEESGRPDARGCAR